MLCSYWAVYPETMGVPLEEMDAVFGEGMNDVFDALESNAIDRVDAEELEERLIQSRKSGREVKQVRASYCHHHPLLQFFLISSVFPFLSSTKEP